MPTEINSVYGAEAAPTEAEIMPFQRVLQTREEISEVIKGIEDGKQADGKAEVSDFEKFLRDFADPQGCIKINVKGETRAIPISEFSKHNPDIQAALSNAIAANDNEPEILETTESMANKQTPTAGTVEDSIPLGETVAQEVSLNPSRQAETILPTSETATPEENERAFAKTLEEVSTPQALVEAIRNVPGGNIRLRSKHSIPGEQVANNISAEGDDRILILASNVNHAGIQNAASRLMDVTQPTQEQTADISSQLPRDVSNEKFVSDNTPTPDTAIKNSDADASAGIIKEAPPAVQKEGVSEISEIEDGINYFEHYFETVDSVDNLKNYLRSMGQTSKDGVLELEDIHGPTRVQYGELLKAVGRFNLGEGTLEEVPGKNIRAALERLSKNKRAEGELEKAA